MKMIKNKVLSMILVSILLFTSMIPVNAFADIPEEAIKVYMNPGEGSGDVVSFTLADTGRKAESADAAGNGQFYLENESVMLKLPDCPETFTPPADNLIFAGWKLINAEEIYAPGAVISNIIGSTMLTARWDENRSSKLKSITPSSGTLDKAFDPGTSEYLLKVEYTGFPISITLEATPEDPDATVEYAYGDDFASTCPALDLEHDSVYIRVTNGANTDVYNVSLYILYSLTLTSEGHGTARSYDNNNVETETGVEDTVLVLKATPDTGWTFKEWVLISGDGTLTNTSLQNSGMYRFKSSNALVKALFEQNPKYNVTVGNGTGGGSFAEGADVTITASDPVPGKQFSEWKGVEGLTFTVGSATTSTATFTMPAKDVSVTADYIDVEVVKTDPVITKSPAVITDLVYNGTAQPLITGGEATGGTLYYTMTTTDTSAPVDLSLYSTDIPAATDAGTYFVWYMVKGDDSHNDTEVEKLTIQIAEATDKPDDPDPVPEVISVSSISLDINADSITMKKNDTRTLAAQILPENASNKDVEWSVVDPSVATVSNGIVTATETGKTTVTVTTKDGGFTASCEILVVDPEINEDVLSEIKSDEKYEQGYIPVEETKKEEVPLNEIPKAKIDGTDVPIPVTVTYQPAVSYTGKSIKGEQLVEKFDKTEIVSGLTLKDGAKITDPLELVAIKYTFKSNKNAGAKDSAYFTAKITIDKKAKRSLSAKDYKALQKKVKAVNKELAKKNERYCFTINKRSVTDGQLVVKVTKNSDGSIKTKKNGSIYKVSSIELAVQDPADQTKITTIKIPAKNYKIDLIDANYGLVRVTGLKNFTGSATVYVSK